MSIIDNLPTLTTPVAGDEIPIERGMAAYKIDYTALASAIIGELGGDPVTIPHGGSGASDKPGACASLEYVNSRTWASHRIQSGSVNDAPLGFASYAGSSSNVTEKPYTFWFDVLTVKSLESNYARQVAFPWGSNTSIAFRVQNGGSGWTAWRYIVTQATAP